MGRFLPSGRRNGMIDGYRGVHESIQIRRGRDRYVGGRGDPHAGIGHGYHVRAPAEALPVQPAALEQAIQMTMEVSTPATHSSARRRTPDTSHLEGQAGYG